MAKSLIGVLSGVGAGFVSYRSISRFGIDIAPMFYIFFGIVVGAASLAHLSSLKSK